MESLLPKALLRPSRTTGCRRDPGSTGAGTRSTCPAHSRNGEAPWAPRQAGELCKNSPLSPCRLSIHSKFFTPQTHGRVLMEGTGSRAHRMFVAESICANGTTCWAGLSATREVPNLALNLAAPSARSNEAPVPSAST